MATSPTPRLGLERPLAGHGFDRTEFYDLYTLLDGFPGIYLCTSGTRPSGWGTQHTGMLIWETDTSLRWRWSGTAFVRDAPKGLLGVSSLTSNQSTGATTPTSVLSKAVTIPAFTLSNVDPRIKVEANWYAIDNGTLNTLGGAEVSLLRGSTVIARQRLRGRPDTATELEWGEGGTIVAWDTPTAGAQTYHLAINSVPSVGGTTTLRATATNPAQLAISEVGV